jgi:hypothetical protein
LPHKALAELTKKVLIVASNMVNMAEPEKHDTRNNLWEFAPLYHIFVSHGFEVDFSCSCSKGNDNVKQ